MALLNVKVEGIKKVIENAKRASDKYAAGIERGLIKAGLFLQRESQLLVPVHNSNLKNSAYTDPSGSGFDTEVEVGFTADYALYVHENVEMKLKGEPRRGRFAHGHYWDPQGQATAKFLEKPYRKYQSDGTFQRIIKAEAEI